MSNPLLPTRVLVVDDSAVVRTIVTEALASRPEIRVETARNGRAGLDAIAKAPPDLVLLDVEMPILDGMATLRELRRSHPRLPVVMFSTLTERGASITLEALAAGANDYLTKPSGVRDLGAARERIRDDVLARIEAMCHRAPRTAAPTPTPPPPTTAAAGAAVDVVAIGCSTGGPNALTALLPELPADLGVPIVVTQHMPPMFTAMLAKSLDAKSRLAVQEGEHGGDLAPGRVWIAPGGRHMTVTLQGGRPVLALTDDPPENSCRPAVDVMFRSVAQCYGPRVLAVVLTGMGSDGCAGGAVIRRAGGSLLAQDEATSVVWGMPGAVARAGLAEAILPLSQIAFEITRRVRRHRPAAALPLEVRP